MPRTVTATRYVTPLREGGSMPAIVEADDDGLYVLKFRGAGQGAKALVAELVVGELARVAGLPIPEIVLVELDPELALTEPDSEIQHLLRSSAGINFGLDYLPGAINYDPVALQPSPELASALVWFDAYVSNVDRTARNTNLLVWHRQIRLIDHGAALYFHHGWDAAPADAGQPFALIRDHVLLPWASRLADADRELSSRITPAAIETIVATIPEPWLQGGAMSPPQQREAYIDYLVRRLQQPRRFVEEAQRAHALSL